MNRPDYTEFDKALLEQIATGRNTMMQLDGEASGLRALAKPFTLPAPGSRTGCQPFRVIDRRLQALRKKGSIRFNGKTWEVA
jgi:hypothetical protein